MAHWFFIVMVFHTPVTSKPLVILYHAYSHCDLPCACSTVSSKTGNCTKCITPAPGFTDDPHDGSPSPPSPPIPLEASENRMVVIWVGDSPLNPTVQSGLAASWHLLIMCSFSSPVGLKQWLSSTTRNGER